MLGHHPTGENSRSDPMTPMPLPGDPPRLHRGGRSLLAHGLRPEPPTHALRAGAAWTGRWPKVVAFTDEFTP